MNKPRSISSGEAMRWNKDVNRRRLEHHERRCAEDAMYRKAYEYQQAEEWRMWERTYKPQRIKTHEEVLQERAAIEAYQRMSDAEKVAAGGNALAMGLIGMMFTCPDALQQHMKELEELKPYLDEIRETDKRFRNEEIKLSGFEW